MNEWMGMFLLVPTITPFMSTLKPQKICNPPTIVDIKLIVITIIRLNTREQPQTILTIYQHCLLLAVCQLVYEPHSVDFYSVYDYGLWPGKNPQILCRHIWTKGGMCWRLNRPDKHTILPSSQNPPTHKGSSITVEEPLCHNFRDQPWIVYLAIHSRHSKQS